MHHRTQLLRILADGQFHSGEVLGSELGISRSAVWKILKTLPEIGLDVQAVPRRGYRLSAPLELLDREKILTSSSLASSPLLSELEIHENIDSTNRLMMQRAREGSNSGHVCLAEQQQEGKGRRGRQWISPFGSNVYLSFLWRFTEGAPDALSTLSLVAGVTTARVIENFGLTGVGMKWPNDILLDGRKLGGILLEFAGEHSGPCYIVSGIGVNYSMPTEAGIEIDQPWTDICSHSNAISRNHFTATLIEALLLAYDKFQAKGFEPFMADWQRLDLCRGQTVVLQVQDGHIIGRAEGIDEQGALLLKTEDGVRRFSSGEVSLRTMR
ncbi:MAG: bifunctional biotin--[acetyl-CoA-carboxylase] ligase/biotin operon repressor BirA [Gammaproteobacteria bacterium]|nr:bifunctional biotin--[acetyl-CoA-carboxylase] ligase/biotin operon repressor BirA [Gammaproteobacteria bacterium]MDH5594341.1 bifunctional biotin--[acetyl-CoA-carboxylase] ligase/biotin operon repressor BirA [Gammaproteobacteria bacterium]MDH5614402.1 bifunctional biotin--[acetyl-CoA-carboxylase] ligase/biotin operon repressor BirA [Gammaproteobacteria bacterium]